MGRTGRLLRRFSLGFIAAMAMLTAVPSGAVAATQIGETFVPTGNCSDDTTFLQSTSPATTSYAAPTAGVITRWSFRSDNESATDVDKLKFKVGRPVVSSLSLDDFAIVGESALQDPVFDTLNSYFIQIPVQAGDVIGHYWATGNTPNSDCIRTGAPGFGFHTAGKPGDFAPGTGTTFSEGPGGQTDISAILEPDCDNDGLGDETQDSVLIGCGPGGTTIAPLTCRGQQLTIVGTAVNDVIVGAANRDVIGALNGNDRVSGLSGNDLICGGSGKDTLLGGKGKDKLLGQAGKDKLRGGGAKDVCKGGKADDSAKGCEVEKSI